MGSSATDVSIVITNRNQGTLLERCIRSCLAQTFPGRFHQVLVVDAGSQDFSMYQTEHDIRDERRRRSAIGMPSAQITTLANG